MLPPEALRALYRCGGRDRLLAERLPGVRGGRVVTAIGNGHEPSRLRAALESAGGSLKSLTSWLRRTIRSGWTPPPAIATVHGLPIPSIGSVSPGSGTFAVCTTS